MVVVNRKNTKTLSAIRQMQSIYNPHSIFILKETENSSELDKIAPWTSSHETINNLMTFYICEDFSCKRPTADIDLAIKFLQ